MKNKENNFVSAVLYIHNNADGIKVFMESLNTVLAENFNKYEIVCVNDSSNDGSVDEIKDLAKAFGHNATVLISTGFYHGLESAMLAGVDFASGDFVFEFDSIIFDYDMSLVMDVYNRCISGTRNPQASSVRPLWPEYDAPQLIDGWFHPDKQPVVGDRTVVCTFPAHPPYPRHTPLMPSGYTILSHAMA